MDNLRYFANKQLVWLHYSAQCALLHNLQYNIYIYMVPPKTYLSNKFSGIYIVFLSI